MCDSLSQEEDVYEDVTFQEWIHTASDPLFQKLFVLCIIGINMQSAEFPALVSPSA